MDENEKVNRKKFKGHSFSEEELKKKRWMATSENKNTLGKTCIPFQEKSRSIRSSKGANRKKYSITGEIHREKFPENSAKLTRFLEEAKGKDLRGKNEEETNVLIDRTAWGILWERGGPGERGTM